MLHKETITPTTLEILSRLMSDERLTGFSLVGGTALALQIGHRISVDLDLFSIQTFDENELRTHLEREYNMTTEFIARETLKGAVGEVQLDCIAHKYEWVDVPLVAESIRLASLKDIAAMKLNAIAGSGTRLKDFIDLAYLSAYFSFNEMLGFYEQKYHASTLMPMKAITFFDEINHEEPVRMLGNSYSWKNIAKRLLNMQKHSSKRFESYP